jgi:hypothetical protein
MLPVPPVTDELRFIVFPEQTGEFEVALGLTAAAGSEITMLLSEAVQPLASVTVTLYVPAGSEEISSVVAPLLHK